MVMVIFLNGSVNSGKTTLAGILAKLIDNAVIIDNMGLAVGEDAGRIEMAESKLKQFLLAGKSVVVDGQVPEMEFLKLRDSLSELSNGFFAFTLRPRLEIATRNRGDRILSQQEVDQVKLAYEQGMDAITYGEVLDNSDESPEQTAKRILEVVK